MNQQLSPVRLNQIVEAEYKFSTILILNFTSGSIKYKLKIYFVYNITKKYRYYVNFLT